MVHEPWTFRCSSWILKRQRKQIKFPTSVEFQKNIYFCFIDYTKAFDVWITINCGKFLKEMGIPDHLTCLWDICTQVKKQQLELEIEQQTGSKLRKEYVKAVYCHPAYLTYMQSTSWEMLGWMMHNLESRLPGEIAVTSDMQMTPLLWQKVKRNKRASWWRWEKRVKKLA